MNRVALVKSSRGLEAGMGERPKNNCKGCANLRGWIRKRCKLEGDGSIAAGDVWRWKWWQRMWRDEPCPRRKEEVE
jgi:hypothetical protein